MLAILLLLLALLPLAFVFLQLRCCDPCPIPTPAGIKKNVMLVVAHPDDETMFFGPTLLSLVSLRIYNVRILSISSGNFEGKGQLRKEEMLAACSVFQVPEHNVEVLDVPELQDGFSSNWDTKLIAELVKQRVSDYEIDMLITFDSYGVSGHPNHCSVHHAIRALLLDLDCGMEAWELTSSTLLRKFLGPLDILISISESHLQRDRSKRHCFYSQDPGTNAKAMRQHLSQWLWYRKLFVLLSRYTYVNVLERMQQQQQQQHHHHHHHHQQ